VTALGLALSPLVRADQSVTLAWNPSPNASVAGYLILSGADGVNFGSQVNAGNNTSWTVAGLQPGSTNYFEVVAYDTNNVQSPPSDPIKYVVPAATQLVMQTVAVQANPSQAGAVNGGGSFATGSSVTVTATANSGYTFTNWTENGIVQCASPNYSFTLAANRNLTANFTANSTGNSSPSTAAPSVATLPATSVSSANATLNATVNSNLSATTVYFEYGPTTAYGSFTATNTFSSGLAQAQTVALSATALQPGATVHFQAVAQDSFGTSFGGDMAFVTPAAGPLVSSVLAQFVSVGSTLLVTNTVSGASDCVAGLTFCLGADAPAGSSISSAGVL